MPNYRDHSSARRFIFSHNWEIQRDQRDISDKSGNPTSIQGNSATVITFEPTRQGWIAIKEQINFDNLQGNQ